MSSPIPLHTPPRLGQSAETTNERLAIMLMRKRVKRSQLAVLLDLAAPAVTRRMSGEIDWRLTELQQVAERLDTTVGYLLGETDDDRRPEHLLRNQKTPAADAEGVLVTPVAEAGLDPATSRL